MCTAMFISAVRGAYAQHENGNERNDGGSQCSREVVAMPIETRGHDQESSLGPTSHSRMHGLQNRDARERFQRMKPCPLHGSF
jgi:hypothetical protein